MSDHQRLTRLLQSIRELNDLEGGRRDLAGILGRGASLAREWSGARSAWAGVTVDGKGLARVARAGQAGAISEPWEGPGRLGRAVLEAEAPVSWTPGEEDELSLRDTPGITEAPGSWVGFPLILPGSAEGVLALQDPSDDLELIAMLSQHLGTAASNLLLYQRTEALALTDELTRLYNFRFLKTALRREMERAARYGQVFSIIMIDVDHLKAYNDNHGHLGGSELLRQLAAILSGSSRAIDLVAKYGGDEFLVILPQTRLEGAMAMANRIRTAVADTAFPHCKRGDMTISVGVASFPQHGDTVETLVGAADTALFRAKRVSRNVVVSADTLEEDPRNRPEAA